MREQTIMCYTYRVIIFFEGTDNQVLQSGVIPTQSLSYMREQTIRYYNYTVKSYIREQTIRCVTPTQSLTYKRAQKIRGYTYTVIIFYGRRENQVLHFYTLPKHAYSNILKISPPKTDNFQIKTLIFLSYFCSKHRLWVLIRTALMRQF